jgi:hypothetical protein
VDDSFTSGRRVDQLEGAPDSRCTLHTELESLRVVLRHCRRGQFPIDSPALEEYFDSRSWFFTRPNFGGQPHRELLSCVLAAVDRGYSDEIAAIEWTRGSVQRRSQEVKLERLQKALAEARPAAQSNVLYVNLTNGSVFMTGVDNSNNATNSTIGAQSGGSQNLQLTGDITQAVAGTTDVAGILEALSQHLAALRGTVPDSDVADAEDIVMSVRDEVAKQQPDQGRLRRLVHRLGEWAAAIGEIAVPVVTAASALAKAEIVARADALPSAYGTLGRSGTTFLTSWVNFCDPASGLQLVGCVDLEWAYNGPR